MRLNCILRCLVMGLPALCATAQVTTATFYGTVADSTGAVIPKANVTVTHEETGAAITRESNENGEVAFDFLKVGAYTVRIEANGFKRHESKGMELSSGQ